MAKRKYGLSVSEELQIAWAYIFAKINKMVAQVMLFLVMKMTRREKVVPLSELYILSGCFGRFRGDSILLVKIPRITL